MTDLSPFHLWSLYKMFKTPKKGYTAEDLLLECCDSAMSVLDPSQTDNEIERLQQSVFVKFDGFVNVFTLSNSGIVYIRRNLAKIQNACNQNKIPSSVIEKQNGQLQQAINNQGDLKELIVTNAVKNIAPIIELQNSVSQSIE